MTEDDSADNDSMFSRIIYYLAVMYAIMMAVYIVMTITAQDTKRECEDRLLEYPQSIRLELLNSYGSCDNIELSNIVNSNSQERVVSKMEELIKERDDSMQSLINSQMGESR